MSLNDQATKMVMEMLQHSPELRDQIYTEKGFVQNFSFLLTSKKTDKEKSLSKVEKSFISDLVVPEVETSRAMVRDQTIYYLSIYHLDLFLRYEKRLLKMLPEDTTFFDKREFFEQKRIFENVELFIVNLIDLQKDSFIPGFLTKAKGHSLLSIDQHSSRLKSLSVDNLTAPSPGLTRKQTLSKSYKSLGMSINTPSNSIFKNLTPVSFTNSLHKIYLSYFYLSKIREYQYVSVSEDREFSGFDRQFKVLVNNLIRKMELEIERFCEAGHLKTLTQYLVECIDNLLDVHGNPTLAEVFVLTIGRLVNCESVFYTEILDRYARIKSKSKYKFLVKPDVILVNFINVINQDKNAEGVLQDFNKNYKNLVQTKQQIAAQFFDLNGKPTDQDIETFAFINPTVPIKIPLYNQENGQIACIKEKCN